MRSIRFGGIACEEVSKCKQHVVSERDVMKSMVAHIILFSALVLGVVREAFPACNTRGARVYPLML